MQVLWYFRGHSKVIFFPKISFAGLSGSMAWKHFISCEIRIVVVCWTSSFIKFKLVQDDLYTFICYSLCCRQEIIIYKIYIYYVTKLSRHNVWRKLAWKVHQKYTKTLHVRSQHNLFHKIEQKLWSWNGI